MCPWLLMGLNILRKIKWPGIAGKKISSMQIACKLWSLRDIVAIEESTQGHPGTSGTQRDTKGASKSLSHQGFPPSPLWRTWKKPVQMAPLSFHLPNKRTDEIINKSIILFVRLSSISKWRITIIILRLFPVFPFLTCPPIWALSLWLWPRVSALHVKIPILLNSSLHKTAHHLSALRKPFLQLLPWGSLFTHCRGEAWGAMRNV